MALTAVATVNQNSVTIHEPLMVTITVSNSGGSPVNMSQITPYVTFTGNTPTAPDASPVACTNSVLINPANQSVPAGGSTAYNYELAVQAPSTKVDDSGSGTYSCGAQCYGADGSSFAATAATVTVHPVLPIF